MHHFSATLLGAAFALLRALFTSPRGRHHRRRRANRVRRYAANPAPATRELPPATPRLVEPRETFPADDIALVRPYYTAHEQARVQAVATARLQQWTGPRIPSPRLGEGDLLAPTPPPVTFDDLADAVRRWQEQQQKQTAGVGA
ncbi:hypothetical protein [Nocardiopsis sp. CC223A]|uniref:hypothetical protein n=1 Tax=Nocardiopsis sp. CC223A TaxID=3044051 RepID=UPI00278BEA31|nr:hypothetical protein [Nocardiopsis sp. CC223A]